MSQRTAVQKVTSYRATLSAICCCHVSVNLSNVVIILYTRTDEHNVEFILQPIFWIQSDSSNSKTVHRYKTDQG